VDRNKKIRYRNTLSFLKKHAPPPCRVLDLGTKNEFSEIMIENGYTVINTNGEDLDCDFKNIINQKVDLVTAFEIFEHMLAPYNILKALKTPKLIASVPLNLWFADSYWNENDDWDKHYHEFEPKQFDFLMKKTNWKILNSKKWSPPYQFNLGIRPIIRSFTNRYYIVHCEKKYV
tara:strand:+ start:1241 stop:1765 length:525 start_codon:yes stop_codon:yes gene_type:complete